jgi:hypothetical protein
MFLVENNFGENDLFSIVWLRIFKKFLLFSCTENLYVKTHKKSVDSDGRSSFKGVGGGSSSTSN